MKKCILFLALTLAAATCWAAGADAGTADDAGSPDSPPGPLFMRGPMPGGGAGLPGPGGLPRSGVPPFDADLFPPELVLSNQLAIGLSEDQLKSIKQLLNETHSRIIDLQTDLQRVTERLSGIVKPSRVDETAALAAAEQAMGLEAQIKKAHLSLVIRVKNILTEEQQNKLRDLRPQAPRF